VFEAQNSLQKKSCLWRFPRELLRIEGMEVIQGSCTFLARFSTFFENRAFSNGDAGNAGRCLPMHGAFFLLIRLLPYKEI
jgi:hypothetical protein